MTQEYDELLVKDLTGRLSCGVKFKWCDNYHTDAYLLVGINGDQTIGQNAEGCEVMFFRGYDKLKPYLRSMKSMTDEESEEYCQLQDKFLLSSQYPVTDAYEMFDWLNEHHFDYRGLIEKDLAIEVTDDDNPYK